MGRNLEDYAPFGCMILQGVLNKEKALALIRHYQSFSIIDERFEISNLDLLRDIERIIKLEKFYR